MSQLSKTLVQGRARVPLELKLSKGNYKRFKHMATYIQDLLVDSRKFPPPEDLDEKKLEVLLKESEADMWLLCRDLSLFVYYRLNAAAEIEMYLSDRKMTDSNYREVGMLII